MFPLSRRSFSEDGSALFAFMVGAKLCRTAFHFPGRAVLLRRPKINFAFPLVRARYFLRAISSFSLAPAKPGFQFSKKRTHCSRARGDFKITWPARLLSGQCP
jgi:hypothetical protein